MFVLKVENFKSTSTLEFAKLRAFLALCALHSVALDVSLHLTCLTCLRTLLASLNYVPSNVIKSPIKHKSKIF